MRHVFSDVVWLVFQHQLLPACLETLYDVPKESFWGAIGKGGPLIIGAFGCVLGGWLTDSLIKRTGNRRWGRRVFGMAGHVLCIPLYIAAINAPNAGTFAVCIALTGFCNDLAIGSAWATCQDIGRRHAAIVAGCMNTIGNLGGFASATIIGWLLRISREHYLIAQQVPLAEFGKLPWEAKRAALLPGYQWNCSEFCRGLRARGRRLARHRRHEARFRPKMSSLACRMTQYRL